MKVEFFKHNIGEKEINRVIKTLRTLFLTTSTVTNEFEKKFARYLHCKQVIGLNSCTGALHLSLFTLGIGPKDEVITTPLSFYASSNPILYVGAKPIFIDVEKDTGLIDTRLIEKTITKKTKAILVVHMYGQMCDMKKINSLAKKYKLKVIEDSALCIAGNRQGVRPGQLSDAACFSFHTIKSITSGEGGAIATNNIALAKKLKFTRLHGIGKTLMDRHNDKSKKQDMVMLGFKYNMYDLQSSLLINQIKKIDLFLKKRETIYGKYEKAFKDNPKIDYPKIVKDSQSAKSMFTLWVDPKKRDDYLAKLQKAGIGVDMKYHSIHLSTYYKNRFKFKKDDFPIAEKISNSTITLPLYPKLKNFEIDYVIKCVNSL